MTPFHGICSTQDWSKVSSKITLFCLGGVEGISGFFLTLGCKQAKFDSYGQIAGFLQGNTKSK
jgi:hypothetical protein